MQSTAERYLAARRLTDRPGTVQGYSRALSAFVKWAAEAHPEFRSFANIDREHALEYAEALAAMNSQVTGRPFAILTRYGMLSRLSTFFSDTADWGWKGVPGRPLLGPKDLPKVPQRVPGYIPEDELEPLMEAIRELECPYKRAALLVARWSGARRDEIKRLSLDCLDAYPDGTPRLKIPAGKNRRERIVPLKEEAAQEIRQLCQTIRPGRGLHDEITGELTHYLFVWRGKLLSETYLFDSPLRKICRQVGLLDGEGKHTITAHRFRHTMGTQLAERGAGLPTIMKVLGHDSANMSIIYARISDQTVLADYQKVLGPGAVVAGPLAETLRSGELPASEVEWIKNNFFRTELELGHCLRLPQEGPCECDLYLTCPKFVTTAEYAPRLRVRRQKEFELIEDAISNGWEREVERHRCTVSRIEKLLEELNEPLEGAQDIG